MVQLARADRFRRTGASLADEVDVADLDPVARTGWTAEQWLRAEAAGLVALAPDPGPDDEVEDEAGEPPLPPLRPASGDTIDGEDEDDEDEIPVWEEADDRYMTSFPPPPGFKGQATGRPGEYGYQRTLTPEEAFVASVAANGVREARVRSGAVQRDRWFRAAAMRLVEPGEPLDPAALDEAEARAEAERAEQDAAWAAQCAEFGDPPADAPPADPVAHGGGDAGAQTGPGGAPCPVQLAICGPLPHIDAATDAH